MNHVDAMVNELAPNGVEYRPISAIASYVRGVTYSKGDERIGGPIRILRSNNITLSSNTLNFDDVKEVAESVRVRSDQRLRANDILISAASGSKAHVGKVAYVEEDLGYYFGGFMAVLRVKGDVDPHFLFYALVGSSFSDYLAGALRSTTINNLNATTMGAFRVPVPPLAVQREVARILDHCAEVQAGLVAELGSESTARDLQYAYYRDALFSFSDQEHVAWRPMGDVGTFTRGKRITKADVVPDGFASIHYGEIYTGYGVSADQPLSRVRRGLAPHLRFAKTGDVVIAGVGETVEDVAKAVAWLGDEDVAFHDDCWAFRSPLNPKFVAYYLQTDRFHGEKNKYVARAKVKRISGTSLAKILIPVPSRERQDRAVEILDKFDALRSELSTSLAVELAARHTQYEFYRDKLIGFEEALA